MLTFATTIPVATVVRVMMGMSRIVMGRLVQVSTSPYPMFTGWVGHFMYIQTKLMLIN